MKKMYKIASLLLVVVMLLGLFTGCGGTKTAGELGDGKIKVGIPANVTIPDYNTNGLAVYLEEKTGLDITWVDFTGGSSGYAQTIGLLFMSGEEVPDVLVGLSGLGHYNINSYGNQGYIQDLSELIKDGKAPNYEKALKSLDPELQKFVQEKGTNMTDGKFYSLPSVGVAAPDDMQSMININKAWLDKVGLDVPTNIKELAAVCKAFQETDCNGNGEADEIPM